MDLTMPIQLVFVRHGESEGNKAKSLYKKGIQDLFTKKFLDRHSSEFRLTDRGREQAKIAGRWIRENIAETFDFYSTSEYVRAMETAGLLGFPGALWERDLDLRERDYGFADLLHPDQRRTEYATELQRFKKNKLINPIPGGGESIAHMRQRGARIFARLSRRFPNGTAILGSHGDFIWGCRMDLEHITMAKFLKMRESKNPFDRIHNCQVIQYSRVNPNNGEVANYYKWMRSVCPSDLSLSSNVWMPIVRRKFTNEELLVEADKYPRCVS